MTRARLALAATLVGASVIANSALAQTTQSPPPMTSILAGRKFTPPIKGQADIEYVKPDTKLEKKEVVTRIKVKNISNAPIPRLTIAETWFDKNRQMVTGNKGFINGLLQPGEIGMVEIRTPHDPRMLQPTWNFAHANGAVKPHLVNALDDPNAKKEPAAKAASATKKK